MSCILAWASDSYETFQSKNYYESVAWFFSGN